VFFVGIEPSLRALRRRVQYLRSTDTQRKLFFWTCDSSGHARSSLASDWDPKRQRTSRRRQRRPWIPECIRLFLNHQHQDQAGRFLKKTCT